MPYETARQLPGNMKSVLPDEARKIFREAYNNAYRYYKDPAKREDGVSREEKAHKAAWSAVKSKYEKNTDGWHRKVSDRHHGRGYILPR